MKISFLVTLFSVSKEKKSLSPSLAAVVTRETASRAAGMNSLGTRLYFSGIALCRLSFQSTLKSLAGLGFVTRFLMLPLDEKVGLLVEEDTENLQKGTT